MNEVIALVPVSYDYRGAVVASGLSERTVRDAIADGSLIAHYQGTKPVILRRDLEAWIESLPTQRPEKERAARSA